MATHDQHLALLVFTGGPWDGEAITARPPPPPTITIGRGGRYTLRTSDQAPPDGATTAHYAWTHERPSWS